MKKIITIALIALLLASCGNEYHARKAYKEYFTRVLKDPKSLVIYSERWVQDDRFDILAVYVEYGAKNGYGAMDRETKAFYFDTKTDMFVVDGECYSE